MPLLRRGVALDGDYISALRDKGVLQVWIDDELSKGVTPTRVLTPEIQSYAVDSVGKAFSAATDALTSGGGLSPEAVNDLPNVATLIAEEVHSSPDVALHLADMMGADQYLVQHVVDVTALGTVLASRLFRERGWIDHTGERRTDQIDPRLAKIALGLLLHDIGKLAVPEEILQKRGPLNAYEWTQIRRHPQMGVDMLGHHSSFLIRAVVKQHHERWDGSGYPDGIAGEQIHQFARIAAVADVYDAVTSERVYKGAMAPHEGVAIIEQGCGTEFDPEVVEVFRKVVMPYPPGCQVTLSDGRTALVVDVDPEAPYEPTVRTIDHHGQVEEIRRAPLFLPLAA